MSSAAQSITIRSAPPAIGNREIADPNRCAKEANWYAVYTMPRHEKRVEQRFRFRDIECFCPLYKIPRRWRDGSKVVLELPLFPNYVFVHMSEIARIRVLGVPGVLAIVKGADGKIATLPDREMAILKSGLASCGAEPHPLLTAGQRVRIRSGPLGGLSGIVVRMKGSARVVLTLDQITKSIAVEIAEGDLESLSSRR